MNGLQVAFYDGGAVVFQEELLIPQRGPGEQASGFLEGFFVLARRSIDWLRSSAPKFEVPALFGRLGANEHSAIETLQRVESYFPVPLESPFEGCDSIAGGVCSGKKALGLETQDALAKLRFEGGTVELPIHVHEHSDRFIVVEDGAGVYHYSPGDLESFDGSQVISVPVQRGDVILFLRNVLHTFSASVNGLGLLSYHAPEIAFDDLRQYTLPKYLWNPPPIGGHQHPCGALHSLQGGWA